MEGLRALAAIATAYENNELDEERPDWLARGVSSPRPFSEIELLSGRGGKRLLTLADAFSARDLLWTLQK